MKLKNLSKLRSKRPVRAWALASRLEHRRIKNRVRPGRMKVGEKIRSSSPKKK